MNKCMLMLFLVMNSSVFAMERIPSISTLKSKFTSAFARISLRERGLQRIVLAAHNSIGDFDAAYSKTTLQASVDLLKILAGRRSLDPYNHMVTVCTSVLYDEIDKSQERDSEFEGTVAIIFNWELNKVGLCIKAKDDDNPDDYKIESTSKG